MPTPTRRDVLRGAAATALGAAVARAALDPSAAAAHPRDHRHRPRPTPLGPAQSLDGRPLPTLDDSRPNRLPDEMVGYWEKSFDVGGAVRTAKVYIAPGTPIRSYYTVVAVPDGVETGEFLVASGWRDVADERSEGLVVLEPGDGGWKAAADESAYVEAAIGFYQSNGYFSIFGEHYLVGYGAGAAPLETWAVANPLKVISQVYLDSDGVAAGVLSEIGPRTFDGTTAPGYTTVDFPDGFDLIRHDEVLVPTWHVHPDRSAKATIAYWLGANDTDRHARRDRVLGWTYHQRRRSERWMTSYSGPISQVSVQPRAMRHADRSTTRQVVAFLTFYTRYENFFAYGNQVLQRADYADLGIEVRTIEVAGTLREYLVYVPDSARRRHGREDAPVVFVWPGNTQTDRVFIDSSAWWQVARDEGFVLVVVCEDYSSAISVTHRDSNAFFLELRDVVARDYDVDPTRFYSTGQSLGSLVSQTFAIAKPEYFAAVASTSFTTAPNSAGEIQMDGETYPAANQPIPNYQIYGYGDLGFLEGTLWDDIDNRLDSWAAYHLGVNGLTLDDVDDLDGERHGFEDRFQTWTWYAPGTSVPAVKVTRNLYRSHNNIPEESPMLWDFLKHYRSVVGRDGTVTRYYSPSAFRRRRDAVEIEA
ncbi:hypothetical protein CLV56_2773 [Mumia flava]|uniref:Poly(3-hydroxybutyrate) depolymerase n=1 Tax=Mumia flava TaxID=1348852 RepID=A0A0B2BN04_9ACTN|nr:hypothetical protein [Mumia flava]PJJ58522.1 hypothetical protein CLV56_2773 [Mumia flava]